MSGIKYGRKVFSLNKGCTVLKTTSVTEKALPLEDEVTFRRRLAEKYQDHQGTIEIVFKHGHPDYAIITFS